MPVVYWPSGSIYSGAICEVLTYQEQTDRTAAVNKSFARTYTKSFFVKIKELNLDPFLVGAATGILTGYSINAVHPVDPWAYVVDIQVSPWDNSDGHQWKVSYTFSSNPDSYSMGGGGGGAGGGTVAGGGGASPNTAGQQEGIAPASRVQNPLYRPADVSVSSSSYTEALICDLNGNQSANVLGYPFLPPVEVARSEIVINASWNMPTPISYLWIGNKEAVNLADWIIGPYTISEYCGCLKNSSSNPVAEEGISYYRWSITVHVRNPFSLRTNQILMERFETVASIGNVSPWDEFKANTGFYGAAYRGVIDNPNAPGNFMVGGQVRLNDPTGAPLNTPVMLDGCGVPTLLPKYRGPNPVDNKSYYVWQKTRKRVNWPNIV